MLVAWDTLTVPTYRHEALASYQSGRVFDDDLLEQLDLAPQLVRGDGLCLRQGRRVRGGRLPRRRGRVRGGAGRQVARRERRPRHVPARQRADLGAAAADGRRRAGADRAGGGARALRRRSEAGTRLHRAPRRPVRQDPRRARRRAEDGGLRARAVREPRGCARRGPLRRRGGRAEALPACCDDGCRGTSPAARRPGADLGPRRRARGRVGARAGSRAAWRRCRAPDEPRTRAPSSDRKPS